MIKAIPMHPINQMLQFFCHRKQITCNGPLDRGQKLEDSHENFVEIFEKSMKEDWGEPVLLFAVNTLNGQSPKTCKVQHNVEP